MEWFALLVQVLVTVSGVFAVLGFAREWVSVRCFFTRAFCMVVGIGCSIDSGVDVVVWLWVKG